MFKLNKEQIIMYSVYKKFANYLYEADDSFADAMDTPSDTPSDKPEEAPDDSKNNIFSFDKKTQNIKLIKYQKTDESPDLDFIIKQSFEYYKNNYSTSLNDVLMVGLPDLSNSELIAFFKTNIYPMTIKFCDDSIKNNKKLVYLGENGVPYINGSFSKDEQGVVAKILYSKYKDTITFDTYQDTSEQIIDLLVKRTGSDINVVTAAIYCYLYIKKCSVDVINKFKTPQTEEILKNNSVNLVDYMSMYNFIFPESLSKSQTEISYIVKEYSHLLMVNLLKMIYDYNKRGFSVVAMPNVSVAYKIQDSVKNIKSIIVSKKADDKKKSDEKSVDTNKEVGNNADTGSKGGATKPKSAPISKEPVDKSKEVSVDKTNTADKKDVVASKNTEKSNTNKG